MFTPEGARPNVTSYSTLGYRDSIKDIFELPPPIANGNSPSSRGLQMSLGTSILFNILAASSVAALDDTLCRVY